MGAYHGESGFQTFSHRKGVFQQSRFNLLWMLRPPFTRVTDGLIRILMMPMNGPGEPQGSQLHGRRSRDEIVRRLCQKALPISTIAGASVLL
jgi:hypothetical protein